MSQGKAPAIQRIMDGTQSFFHDLFKSDTRKLIKCIFNRDPKIGQQPEDLQHLDHQHLFHSHDSNGRPQDSCHAVGGHFHKIRTHDDKGNQLLDAQGRPRVECGKPMRKVKVRRGRKMVTVEEEVKFVMGEDGKVLKDDHTHTFVYVKSQDLNPDKIQQLKKEAGMKIMGAFEGAPKIEDKTPAQLNNKDGVQIT